MGNLFSLGLSGFIAEGLGWESIFYIFGGAGLVWMVFWIFLVFSTPAQHPRISTVREANEFYNYELIFLYFRQS